MAQMTDMTGGGYRTLVLALRFVNGAVSSLVGTYDSSYAYPDTHLLEINGTQGRWSSRTLFAATHSSKPGMKQQRFGKRVTSTTVTGNSTRTFDKYMDALLTAFNQGQPPPIHAQAGRRALALAYAAIQSFEKPGSVFYRSLKMVGIICPPVVVLIGMDMAVQSRTERIFPGAAPFR